MPYCAEELPIGTRLIELATGQVWRVTGSGRERGGSIYRNGEFLPSPFTFNVENTQGQRTEIGSCDIGDERGFRFALAKKA